MSSPSGFRTGTSWPLTGRNAELAELADALTAPTPRSVMLGGPAGVGKTRLARETQQLVAATGRRTQWLSATHSMARAPLGIFAPLLPSAPEGEPGGSASMPALLTRSALSLLGDGPDRPVLFVDDAHLLDDLSAALLHQLATAYDVPMLLTVRSGEVPPEPVTALWKDDIVVRVELERLEPDAVERLLAAVLGGPIDPASAAHLAERSGGNVLFLRELTQAALSQGLLHCDHALWNLTGELAPSARIIELAGARLRTLDPAAAALLELVAYAEPLGGAELTALTTEDAVRTLVRQELVVSKFAGGRHELRLAHPIYGEVVRAGTSALRSAEMGRALADIVEGHGARRRDDAIRLGMWRLDGGGGDPALMLRAAWAARRHYDFALAERLARMACRGPQAFEAHLLVAKAMALQGRPVEAEAELCRLEPLASTDTERTSQAIAHIDCLWFYLGRMVDGLAVAERAEASITDPGLRDEIAARRAGLLLGHSGPDAAVDLVVPLMRRMTGPTLIWCGLLGGYSLGRQGRIGEALEAVDTAHRAAAGLDNADDWYPWFLLFARCEVLAYGGRLAEADDVAREQYQRGLAEGSTEARAFFLWHRSRAALERGHAAEVIRLAAEANTLARALGRLGFQHSLLSLLASAHALRGDAESARAALVEIDALDIDQPGWSLTEHLTAQGWVALADGRPAEAAEWFTKSAEAGTRIGDRVGALAALHALARTGGAAQALPAARALTAAMEGELVETRVAHIEALAVEDAAPLERVAARFEAMGLDLYAAESLSVAGSLLRAPRLGPRGDGRAQGTSRRDVDCLARAAHLAAKCTGVHTPGLGTLSEQTALTPAELQTARLAAAGQTSKEIADELTLSVRTVDNRLQAVYQKLGVRRRGELRGKL